MKRLKKSERHDLLRILQESVNPNDRSKCQVHNVFISSSDIKKIITEKFMKQKLNYIHKNPVSEKWKLVENYDDYVHSNLPGADGTGFYEVGRIGIYKVVHYTDVLNIPQR